MFPPHPSLSPLLNLLMNTWMDQNHIWLPTIFLTLWAFDIIPILKFFSVFVDKLSFLPAVSPMSRNTASPVPAPKKKTCNKSSPVLMWLTLLLELSLLLLVAHLLSFCLLFLKDTAAIFATTVLQKRRQLTIIGMPPMERSDLWALSFAIIWEPFKLFSPLLVTNTLKSTLLLPTSLWMMHLSSTCKMKFPTFLHSLPTLLSLFVKSLLYFKSPNGICTLQHTLLTITNMKNSGLWLF